MLSNPLGRGVLLPTDGVPGFQGTATAPRVAEADAPIFYVDSGHSLANDANDGTSPDAPLATIQGIIDRTAALAAGTGTRQPVLQTHSVIYVSGTVSEDVQTGDYTQMPGYVSIIGVGNSRYAVQWEGDDADTPSLDLRCVGWLVSGFRFYGKTGAACIVLRHTDTGANDIAIRTIIEGNYFDGLTTGLRGIESHGCYDVWVVNNTFMLWHNVGGTAVCMEVTTTPLAIPYRNYVLNNHFGDCDNGMVWPSNGSYFHGNVVQPVGYAYSMTDVFQTSIVANPGDDNIVGGNTLAGDYSIAGGYRGGAADVWIGNFADDVAEAEVGDNGFTILPPA